MNNRLQRTAIEKSIIAKANQLHWHKPHCFDETSVDEFIAAWFDLVRYYENNDDSDIGVELMREVVNWSEVFWTIANDKLVDVECRNTASDASNELKSQFLGIVKIVEQRLYPTGRHR